MARIATQVDQRICASVDSGAVRQILLNLMDNAVKYGPAGQTIRVVLDSHAQSARIVVEDEGPGVPAADATRIFEPFNRLSRPGEATVLVEDIYVRDRQLGVTIEANIGVAGDVRGGSGFPVMSPDGRHVIFGADSLGFTPADMQPLSEVFARALTPEDFAAP